MSTKELERLQRQQEANAIAIQRMQHNQSRQAAPQHEEHQTFEEPQYQQEDPNKIMVDAIINEAGNRAAHKAADQMTRQQQQQNVVTSQMKELVARYPALQQDDSALVVKAREIYPKMKQDNPTLPEHVLYRMSVNEAATYIGARPTDAPIDDYMNSDFTMGGSRNPALPKRTGGLKRLTPAILENARQMRINIDKNTPEGKKNLEEMAFYTERFNADKDESEFGYR